MTNRYQDIDVKKALRHSAEATHDRSNLTFLLALLLLGESFLIVWIAFEARNHHESLTAAPTAEAVIIGVMLGPAAAYYGWSLWRTCRKPENYQICEGRLTDPAPAWGRGMVSMTAVFTDESGQVVRRETRGIFRCSQMCWYNDMTEYNNQEVLIAYDPAGERFTVLGRKQDFYWRDEP